MNLMDEGIDLMQEPANIFQLVVELLDGSWCSTDAVYQICDSVNSIHSNS